MNYIMKYSSVHLENVILHQKGTLSHIQLPEIQPCTLYQWLGHEANHTK